MRSEDHAPVLSMSMMGTPACLAAEEEAAQVLCAHKFRCLNSSLFGHTLYPTANCTGTYSMMRLMISQIQLGFLFSVNNCVLSR